MLRTGSNKNLSARKISKIGGGGFFGTLRVDLWLAITKSYFKNDNFEVYAEKKVKKELCTQFRAKSKSNSQIYIVNFSCSGRVAINAK